MYVMAVETKPEAQAFRVAHHITTNLIEDEDDPTGLFFNEYALGKNGDLFPRDSGRLIKAGSKINFNLHLHPYGQATDVQASLGLKLFPKGVVPKYVAFTQHMGDVAELDLPAGEVTRSDGYFRLPKPALISAFQPHMHNRGKAQCMEAIYPDVRADSARPGPARTETLSCVSNYQFGWHITYPVHGRGRAAAAGRHDHPHHLVARQHGRQQVQPEPEELGGQRPAHDRRDGVCLGQPDLSRRGRLRSARRRPTIGLATLTTKSAKHVGSAGEMTGQSPPLRRPDACRRAAA